MIDDALVEGVQTIANYRMKKDYPLLSEHHYSKSDVRKLKEQKEIMKSIKVVYVAGAFRAKTQWGIMQNVRKAEDASLKLWKLGCAVICPHTMTQHFQNECPDTVWLDGCLELLKRCDAIYLVEGWQTSEGSLAEYKLAKELGLFIIGNGDIDLNKEKTCPLCGCFYEQILPNQVCPRCKGE